MHRHSLASSTRQAVFGRRPVVTTEVAGNKSLEKFREQEARKGRLDPSIVHPREAEGLGGRNSCQSYHGSVVI